MAVLEVVVGVAVRAAVGNRKLFQLLQYLAAVIREARANNTGTKEADFSEVQAMASATET